MDAVNSGRHSVVVAASDALKLIHGHADYRCSGTADDVDIQLALDQVSAAGGGTVSLSNGAFSLSAGITIPSNCSLIGANTNATVLTWADGAYHRIENSDTSGGNSYIRLSSMSLDFGGIAGSADYQGLRFENVTDFWMDNVELSSAPHHNLVSIAGTNARWYLRDSYSHDAGQRTATDGDGFRVADGFLEGSPEVGGTLSNCRATANSNHGIHLGPGCVAVASYAWNNGDGGTGGTNLYLSGDEAQAIGGQFRSPNGSHNVLIENCENGLLQGAFCDGSSASADNIRINGAGNAGFKCLGNTAINSVRHNISLRNSDGVIISGNVVDGASAATVGIYVEDSSNSSVIGNIIKSHTTGAGRGIEVTRNDGTIDELAIMSNQIHGNTTGIFVENDGTNITDLWTTGNILNNTTDVNDAGTIRTTGSELQP